MPITGWDQDSEPCKLHPAPHMLDNKIELQILETTGAPQSMYAGSGTVAVNS